MSLADEYRVKAGELAERARVEKDPLRRAELKALEHSFLRLAIQAEKNAGTNIVYETPSDPPVAQRQQQQQQQQQPKKKPEK